MNRPLTVLLAIAALTGCKSTPPSGTSVGNPGKGVVRLAEATELDFEMVFSDGGQVTALACDGTERTASLDQLLDGVPFELPAGELCTLRADFPSALFIDGTQSGGGAVGTFELTLVLDAIEVTPELLVDGEDYVLELGAPDWVTPTSLGMNPVGTTVVGPGDPQHDAIVSELELGTGLYADDGDGLISDPERAAGPI